MAKVPYQPFATEQPIESSGARGVNVRAPEEAFGTNVASAIAHAGTMVEGAGNELFNRAIAMKQLDNEAEARQITNDAELSLANLRVGYQNKQGAEAKDGLTQYQDAVRGVYADAKGRASNQAVQRMVDGQTASAMRSSIFAGATHAAAEGKKWQISTLTNRFDSYKNRLLSEPDNENLWNEASEQTAKLMSQLGDFQGEPPNSDNRKHDLAAAMSDLHSSRIKGMSAKDPERAARMLEENKAFILGQDQDKIEGLVTNRLQTQLSARGAHAVNSDFAPYMSASDITRFNGVDERLQRVFQLAQRNAYKDGVTFTIGDKGGVRTQEEQEQLYRAGYSRTLHGLHTEGKAFDAVPLGPDGKPNYNDKEGYAKIEQYIYAAAQELGVELGPEHKQISSWDPGHYSLPRDGPAGPLTTYKRPTLQEKVDSAKKWYSELRPGDDVGLIKVENAVIGQHGKFERIEKQQVADDRNKVKEAVLLDPENMPYTVQDLLARGNQIEGLEDSWERLQKSDPGFAARIQQGMAKHRVTEDDAEERRRLEGLADPDNGHRQEFLDEDIVNNPRLKPATARTLHRLQQQIEKGEGMPRGNQAFNWMHQDAALGPAIDRLGFGTRTKANAKQRDIFIGTINEAVQSWMAANNGRPPKPKDIIEEIGPDVMSRVTAEDPGWLWTSRIPLYKQTLRNMPEALRKDAVARFKEEHPEVDPTDAEIFKSALRLQFNQVYGKRAAAKQEAAKTRGPR